MNQDTKHAAGWARVLAITIGSVLLFLSGCESISEPKVGAANPQVQGPREDSASHAADREHSQVQAILSKWIEAQGGERRLAALKNARCLINLQEAPTHCIFEGTDTADGRYRFSLLDTNSYSGGFDGHKEWLDRGNWGAAVYNCERADQTWALLCLHTFELEKRLAAGRLLPDVEIEGAMCRVLEVSDKGGTRELWNFDRDSGLLRRVVKNVGKADQQAICDYRDYRKVSKISIPHEMTYTRGAGVKSVYTYVQVEFNGSLAGIEFSPSAALQERSGKIEAILTKSVSTSWTASPAHTSLLVHATIYSPTSGIETSLTLRRRQPDRILVEKESPGAGRTVSGFNGALGWENSDVLGFHVLKDGELSDLISLSWLGSDPFLRERFPVRSWFGESNLEGNAAVALGLKTFGNVGGKFYFAQDDNRLLRTEYDENPTTHAQGTRIDYSDFRSVGSFLIPFRVTYKNSLSETVITCKSVELDVPMPDSLFEPPTDTN